MGRVRRRVGDKQVLGLVKAFLRAGILTEDGLDRRTITGTPQGGILSPLLANIALSVLDEHFTHKWEALGPYWTRAKKRREGKPVMRLVRYADDFVVLVAGQRGDRTALGRGQLGVGSDGPCPVGSQDQGVPHRRGVRLPGMAYPTSLLARTSRQESRLHLPVQTELALSDGQDTAAHPPTTTSNARRPAARRQPDAAGMVQLLPPRRVVTDVQLPRPLRLLADRRVAPQTTPRAELGNHSPSIPPRMGDPRRTNRAVPATIGRHRAIPIPGRSHPHTMDEPDTRILTTNGMTTWRAGCVETCTSGSEGGPEKPTR